MSTRFLLCLSLLLPTLAGCIPTLPELLASREWQGRDAKQAIDFFGPPLRMEPLPGGGGVQLGWYRDTTYVRQEVVGSSAQMQGNVMVQTNYWDDVSHPGGCTILMTVDKARHISDFSTKGRCNGVNLAP
ncbi:MULTISPECIES: hypothetical protein [unclassified Pseudomonas]|uniref:hypothetical protein n=1 Tax=unclassified Pseudomonas TaxID=196821 RepID=UPI000CD32A89|nr:MULTISPECIES: hypothetical protein [unclassified Pseudomonas]POA54882.1 hypothetical protein C1889_15250 [Pseudomonas sp. FW507-12TSA]